MVFHVGNAFNDLFCAGLILEGCQDNEHEVVLHSVPSFVVFKINVFLFFQKGFIDFLLSELWEVEHDICAEVLVLFELVLEIRCGVVHKDDKPVS